MLTEGQNRRLPLSFTASVAIHALLFVVAAAVLRALPATISHDVLPATLMSADIIYLPPFDDRVLVPLPEITVEPIQPVVPPPQIPITRTTEIPGKSVDPATVQIATEFAPVGRISYGMSDGKRLFGPGLAARMSKDYQAIPARSPRLNGTLSVMYPVKGAAIGQSLVLTALLTIDERGAISGARVLPDDPVFVAAVLEALKGARFVPAEFAGKPIPYWAALDFEFTIDGPTGPDGKRLDR